MKVNRDNLKVVKEQLKKLGKTKLQFGCIPGTHPGTNMSYAELMDIHETGRTITNGWGKGIRIVIPARAPFRNTMRSEKVRSGISETLTELIKENTGTKGIAVKKIQDGLGEAVKEEIQDAISQGLTEYPLKKSTLDLRAKNGIGGNLPLFATHLLRGSIDFQTK